MECQKCGVDKDVLQCSGGRFLCDRCFLSENPPEMTLVEMFSPAYEDGHKLYNQTLNCYEDAMTIKTFQSCGWFLRQMRKKHSYTIYELEYHGEKKCTRCKNHRFPKEFARCLSMSICQYAETEDWVGYG